MSPTPPPFNPPSRPAASQPAAPLAGAASEVYALKNRATGELFPFNADTAQAPDMVPVDAQGNEVFNTPFSASAPRPDLPPATITGVPTLEEVSALRTRVSHLEEELARVSEAVHNLRQQQA